MLCGLGISQLKWLVKIPENKVWCVVPSGWKNFGDCKTFPFLLVAFCVLISALSWPSLLSWLSEGAVQPRPPPSAHLFAAMFRGVFGIFFVFFVEASTRCTELPVPVPVAHCVSTFQLLPLSSRVYLKVLYFLLLLSFSLKI